MRKAALGLSVFGCLQIVVGFCLGEPLAQATGQAAPAKPSTRPHDMPLAQVKKRYDAKQRQAIYRKIVAAETKALRDARAAIPDPAPNEPEPGRSTAAEDQAARADAFASENRHDVAVHYHLTDDQAEAVKSEGIAKHWRSAK